MKIGPLDTKPVATPTAERKPTPAATADLRAEPSARVDLSPAAAGAKGVDGAEASFDSAKVERIAQAIRDGKFSVDADAIADKLIANAQELLARKPS